MEITVKNNPIRTNLTPLRGAYMRPSIQFLLFVAQWVFINVIAPAIPTMILSGHK